MPQGIIHVSTSLLREALALPDDVSVVNVHMDQGGPFAQFIVEGDQIPESKGALIPLLYPAILVEPDGTVKWDFDDLAFGEVPDRG